MKTLLIGFYDYSWHSTAYELDSHLTEIELSAHTFDVIHRYLYQGYLDFDEEDFQVFENLKSKYERIIVCEDGEYDILK